MKKCSHCGMVLLSPTAEKVLKFVEGRLLAVTALKVAGGLDMSLTNVNNYLRDLWVCGLLNRISENVSGGGRQFLYARRR